jgi:hypothetical protein
MARLHSRSATPWFLGGIAVAVLFLVALAFALTSAGRRAFAGSPAPGLYTSANR